MARLAARLFLSPPCLRTCFSRPSSTLHATALWQRSFLCPQGRSLSSPAVGTASKPQAQLIRSEPGLEGLDERLAEYRAAPTAELLEDAMAILRREGHRLALDQRLASMLEQAAGASRFTEETTQAFRNIANLVSVISFEHERLGDEKSDMAMESLEKEISLNQEGKDELTLRFIWSSSSSRLQGGVPDAEEMIYGTQRERGLGAGERSAEVFANGIRILYATELSANVSHQAWAAIQAHLGAQALPPKDFRFLLAAGVSYPSDTAFDALSAALEEEEPPDTEHGAQ